MSGLSRRGSALSHNSLGSHASQAHSLSPRSHGSHVSHASTYSSPSPKKAKGRVGKSIASIPKEHLPSVDPKVSEHSAAEASTLRIAFSQTRNAVAGEKALGGKTTFHGVAQSLSKNIRKINLGRGFLDIIKSKAAEDHDEQKAVEEPDEFGLDEDDATLAFAIDQCREPISPPSSTSSPSRGTRLFKQKALLVARTTAAFRSKLGADEHRKENEKEIKGPVTPRRASRKSIFANLDDARFKQDLSLSLCGAAVCSQRPQTPEKQSQRPQTPEKQDMRNDVLHDEISDTAESTSDIEESLSPRPTNHSVESGTCSPDSWIKIRSPAKSDKSNLLVPPAQNDKHYVDVDDELGAVTTSANLAKRLSCRGVVVPWLPDLVSANSPDKGAIRTEVLEANTYSGHDTQDELMHLGANCQRARSSSKASEGFTFDGMHDLHPKNATGRANLNDVAQADDISMASQTQGIKTPIFVGEEGLNRFEERTSSSSSFHTELAAKDSERVEPNHFPCPSTSAAEERYAQSHTVRPLENEHARKVSSHNLFGDGSKRSLEYPSLSSTSERERARLLGRRIYVDEESLETAMLQASTQRPRPYVAALKPIPPLRLPQRLATRTQSPQLLTPQRAQERTCFKKETQRRAEERMQASLTKSRRIDVIADNARIWKPYCKDRSVAERSETGAVYETNILPSAFAHRGFAGLKTTPHKPVPWQGNMELNIWGWEASDLWQASDAACMVPAVPIWGVAADSFDCKGLLGRSLRFEVDSSSVSGESMDLDAELLCLGVNGLGRGDSPSSPEKLNRSSRSLGAFLGV